MQIGVFYISVDFPFPEDHNPRKFVTPLQLRKFAMFSPSNLAGKKVLLIDRNQPTRDVRASVLRSRGVEVHAADSLQAARFLWQPGLYHFILLDVRRHLPVEALEFYKQIKTASPKEHFVFLVGPPAYLSLTWPDDGATVGKKPQRRAEKIKRFLAAA